MTYFQIWVITFSNPKIQIWVIFVGSFKGLSTEASGLFYARLVYFTASWYNYAQLVNFIVILYIFSRFDMLYQEKSGNPVREAFFGIAAMVQ
jgi:uncharacterized membrane protein